jgi:hypothetical protein
MPLLEYYRDSREKRMKPVLPAGTPLLIPPQCSTAPERSSALTIRPKPKTPHGALPFTAGEGK